MCDTLVSLTPDGVLFAKNSDRDPNEAQYLDWIPRAHFPDGETLRCTWIGIPQVRETRAVLLSRPWWIWGAEMGANDAGLVIGNEAVFTTASRRRSPRDEPALLGMDLVRLGLERADRAELAVSQMVDLLERFGQGGAHSHAHPRFTYDNSFIVADADSAFVLETAGREWAVEEVRPGSYRSISNGLTIEPFAKVHGDRVRTRVSSAKERCRQTTHAARMASTPSDLAAALRGHGDSSVVTYSILNGAMAAPCMHAGGLLTASQTVASWISDLRGTGQHWTTATSAPCVSLFKPVSVNGPCDLGVVPEDSFDDRTLWWRHERLHRLAIRDINASLARLAPERDRIEREWFASPPDPLDAFMTADEVERRWAEELSHAQIPDVRPLWLRRYWRSIDSHAGFDPSAPAGAEFEPHDAERAAGSSHA